MLSITFPTVSPILLEFGPIAIRWYSLAYIFGFIFAWKYIQHLISQGKRISFNHEIKSKDVDDIIFYALLEWKRLLFAWKYCNDWIYDLLDVMRLHPRKLGNLTRLVI